MRDLFVSGAGPGTLVLLQVCGQIGTPTHAEPLPLPGQALEGFPQVSRVPVADYPSPEL